MHPIQHRLQLPKLSIPELQSPPTTFTAFPKLPPELRLRVWSLIANIPQKIPVRNRYIDELHPGGRLAIPDSHHYPSILRICREARREALKYYTAFWKGRSVLLYTQQTFSSGRWWERADEQGTVLKMLYEKAVYFNFNADILLLEGKGMDGCCYQIHAEDDLDFETSIISQFQRLEYHLDFNQGDEIFPDQDFLGSRNLSQMILVRKNSASAQFDDVLSCSSRIGYEATYRNGCNAIRKAASAREIPVEFQWVLPDHVFLPPLQGAV